VFRTDLKTQTTFVTMVLVLIFFYVTLLLLSIGEEHLKRVADSKKEGRKHVLLAPRLKKNCSHWSLKLRRRRVGCDVGSEAA